MDPAKHTRETLSKEGSDVGPGNRLGQDIKDDATWKQRFYECTFCRRGFTNPQALGGHMNIRPEGLLCMNNQHGAQPYYYSIRELQKNYQKGLSASPATLFKHQVNYIQSFDFKIPSLAGLSRECELSTANLSLSISRSSVEIGQVKRSDEDSEEIDLELRLGRSCYLLCLSMLGQLKKTNDGLTWYFGCQ
ncbi:hypothetical protein ACJRO7_031900 [Eucalyptus globulus]|uniref:C2H2-type domain-containing protein n=1 Tax=Eucalyptus globulus TaxID=34317 RepID=A0ABD3JIU0_EUCGL